MQRLIRLLATVALFAMVAGCAPRYIPVNHYIETERVKVKVDSVHYSDTVRIAERGDTVLLEVVKWRTRYKTTTDTIIKTDTVQLPPELLTQPAPKPRQNKLLWGFAGIGLVAILYGVYRLLRLFKVF